MFAHFQSCVLTQNCIICTLHACKYFNGGLMERPCVQQLHQPHNTSHPCSIHFPSHSLFPSYAHHCTIHTSTLTTSPGTHTHIHTHTHTPGLIHGLGFYRHCYCERKAEDPASHGSRESASRVQVSPRSSHCRERVREQSAVRNTACTQTYHIVGPMPGSPALHSVRHSPVSLV